MPAKRDTKVNVNVSNLEWIDVETTPRFYTNSVQIRMSTWDLVFRFGEFTESVDGGFRVREVARVAMSPQHAKAVSELLSRYIDDYEKENGVLPIQKRSGSNE